MKFKNIIKYIEEKDEQYGICHNLFKVCHTTLKSLFVISFCYILYIEIFKGTSEMIKSNEMIEILNLYISCFELTLMTTLLMYSFISIMMYLLHIKNLNIIIYIQNVTKLILIVPILALVVQLIEFNIISANEYYGFIIYVISGMIFFKFYDRQIY